MNVTVWLHPALSISTLPNIRRLVVKVPCVLCDGRGGNITIHVFYPYVIRGSRSGVAYSCATVEGWELPERGGRPRPGGQGRRAKGRAG